MKKMRLLICAFCLLCCCVICFSGCGEQTPDTPANSSAETETVSQVTVEPTAPVEDDSGENPPQDTEDCFVDDREGGNETADDLFGGNA